MKTAVLIGDGMGDYPLDELGGKTVLEAARTPNMDRIASGGRGGFAQTIPPGMHPGSDVANMEIMSYDTTRGFTGRAFFEALSMGCSLGEDDVAFRTNLVTLDNGVMEDYSAGHITTEEAGELMHSLDEALGSDGIRFFPGVSYRHLMIWSGGTDAMTTTPPHDIIGLEYGPYLPEGEGAGFIRSLMEKSRTVFADTLVNRKRLATGKPPATSIWFWGQGRNMKLDTFADKFGIRGGVISAVDLVKGIGVAAGLEPVFVPGATGWVDTNYRGKAEAALKTLEHADFVYVHVEAPDEAAHIGSVELKIQAIEDFDREVVGAFVERLEKGDDLAVLVTCDHRTPIAVRTHTREPVPFAFSGPGVEPDGMMSFSERAAEAGSVSLIRGHEMLNLFLGEFLKK